MTPREAARVNWADHAGPQAFSLEASRSRASLGGLAAGSRMLCSWRAWLLSITSYHLWSWLPRGTERRLTEAFYKAGT